MAKTLYEKFLKFEIVLAAVSFQRIFNKTTPLSEYLPTSGLDLMQAWRIVETIITELQCITRNFETILDSATKYLKSANKQLYNYQDLI